MTTEPKRTIVYCRVSSDEQKKRGEGLPDQEIKCMGYKNRYPEMVLVEPPMLEDFTGMTLDRPLFSRVRQMIKNREIDVLIANKPHRISRDELDYMVIRRDILRAGIELHYVSGGGKIDLGNFGVDVQQDIEGRFASEWRKEILANTQAGKRLKIERGSVMTTQRPPYGYVQVPEVQPDRKTLFCLRENPEEAKWVKLIFHWFVYGDESGPMTIDGIKNRLELLGVSTPSEVRPRPNPKKKKRGHAEWSKSTLYGILQNKTYIGTWLYHVGGRQGDEVIPIPDDAGTVDMLISQEVFDLAQAKFENNKGRFRGKRVHQYLLSSRITCMCDYKMRGQPSPNHLYYRCVSRAGVVAQAGCKMPHVRLDWIDEEVWRWLSRTIMQKGGLRKSLEQLKAQRERELSAFKDELAMIETELKEREALLAGLLRGYYRLAEDDEITRVLLDKDRKQFSEDIKKLSERRQKLVDLIRAKEITEADIQAWENAPDFSRLGIAQADVFFEKRRQYVEIFDVQVVMSLDGQGRQVAHVKCTLDETILVRQFQSDRSAL